MIRLMVMESYFTQMGMYMREIGRMIKLTVTGSIFIQMVPFMRVSGLMINNMD
jgi:hypothetical protein